MQVGWAAKKGHLDCLKYAHENGCVSSTEAAHEGNVEYLKYTHVRGYTSNKETCIEAVQMEYLDCLRYLHLLGQTLVPALMDL
jgi:hypothetical protein